MMVSHDKVSFRHKKIWREGAAIDKFQEIKNNEITGF